MSKLYDEYIREHKDNVTKAYYWLYNNLPGLFANCELDIQICYAHDCSKNDVDEYEAYNNYFYGQDRSFLIEENFNKAWLKHIHKNPHHWQHWVLIDDEANEGYIVLDMPYKYIIEMICDWWSFSFKHGNLYSIFDWYDSHKNHIKFSDKTRTIVEDILMRIYEKLEADNHENN